MAAVATPWVDVHAHPGRCFMAGLDAADPLAGVLGGQHIAAALSAAQDARMAAVTLSTVADLRVLAPDPIKGLRASRPFRPGEAYADHRRQLAGITQTLTELGKRPAVTSSQVEAAWDGGQTAVLLSCEGGDFLDDSLESLAEARAFGVSSLTLVHYRVNDIGDVQTEPPVHDGLTAFGRQVVAECNRLGMIIDCAHATFPTTADVLETSRHPIMISHSHLDHPGSGHPRLLSPAHAAAVADAGGLIGVWPAGVVATSLAEFADEIVRLTDLVGPEHVAVGTDMDANYRPVLTGYTDFAALPDLLASRGLSDTDTGKVLGGNALDLLRTVAGQAD
jgi:membrane dipeptidase